MTHIDSGAASYSPGASVLSRRRLLTNGVSLFAVGVLGATVARAMPAGVHSIPGGSKPTFVPERDSRDPWAHSVAENLFWNEQMMEHAAFFVMLMPGPKLAGPRAEAEAFKASFAQRLADAGKVGRDQYVAFNRGTTDAVKRLVDYKHRMRDAQAAGKLGSLTWPTFFDHTAREGEYFIARLGRLSAGDVELDRAEAAEFWTLIMGEHASFIAHLLDPAEQALVDKAMKTSEAFDKLHGKRPIPRDKAIRAVEDILDFKAAAEKGIVAGEIRSIIDPALADHVRREAIKAADDLRRSA